MGKFGQVTERDIVRVAGSMGWVYARGKGSHRQYVLPGHPGMLTIVHSKGVYHPETFARVLRQLGIGKQECHERLRSLE